MELLALKLWYRQMKMVSEDEQHSGLVSSLKSQFFFNIVAHQD